MVQHPPAHTASRRTITHCRDTNGTGTGSASGCGGDCRRTSRGTVCLELAQDIGLCILSKCTTCISGYRLKRTSSLNTVNVDVVVLSACVQMPSLAAIQKVQDRIGKPVISAAVATTYFLLKEMGLKPIVPNAGALLSGKY